MLTVLSRQKQKNWSWWSLAATTTSTNQQVDNTAMVDNVDDPEPESTLPADDKASEPQASKPLLEDVESQKQSTQTLLPQQLLV